MELKLNLSYEQLLQLILQSPKSRLIQLRKALDEGLSDKNTFPTELETSSDTIQESQPLYLRNKKAVAKSALLSISTWTDEDLLPIEEAQKLWNTWTIDEF